MQVCTRVSGNTASIASGDEPQIATVDVAHPRHAVRHRRQSTRSPGVRRLGVLRIAIDDTDAREDRIEQRRGCAHVALLPCGQDVDYSAPCLGLALLAVRGFQASLRMGGAMMRFLQGCSRCFGLVSVLCAVHGCASVPSYSGAELYASNCASCHGVYGEGDGPASPALSVVMQDLRRLSARNGGAFPQETVTQLIDGRARRAAHGGDMPIWGAEFQRAEGYAASAERRVAAKIEALTSFLERIQVAY